NCPDVVQTLNSFARLNPNIRHRMIDGGLYPELVADRGVQGVPAVFLNGERFADGKIDPGQLVEKLLAALPKDAMKSQATQKAETVDVAIVGGGPAGTAAAVYSARKGL